jgi:hypothetical protein
MRLTKATRTRSLGLLPSDDPVGSGSSPPTSVISTIKGGEGRAAFCAACVRTGPPRSLPGDPQSMMNFNVARLLQFSGGTSS